MIYDLNYFTKRKACEGLGLSLIGLQRSDVSIQQIFDYLGDKFHNNGWKILPPQVTVKVQ